MNALLVIDVQESFRRGEAWSQVSNPDLVDDVNRLVAAARARGELVVWILHSEPGSGGVFDPLSGHVVLQAGLTPVKGEPTLVKTTRNAFTSTDLSRVLTRAGTRNVTISGIQTEQCCETTARLAADLGFEVDFVTEATATFPIARPDTGEVLSAAAVIERTEFALAGRFATIRTLDEAVEGAA
ncbi:hydrolase [Tsukamurella pulmonis]|uniref:isochorismatase family protein n=1 Tax=Tsukamurella pulmonis TaxID=47312 RepID=UPI001EDF834E|nr:isochorismatase family protein [Tsukamurella pulmonis]BDD80561.1 hydrolase [Tsukamurella pulmonis]